MSRGGGGRGARVSHFFTMNPSLEYVFFFWGGGGMEVGGGLE